MRKRRLPTQGGSSYIPGYGHAVQALTAVLYLGPMLILKDRVRRKRKRLPSNSFIESAPQHRRHFHSVSSPRFR
jgi:hypothetical protein